MRAFQGVYLDVALLKDANAVDYLTQCHNLASCGVDLDDADMLNTLLNITVELPKIKEMTLYIEHSQLDLSETIHVLKTEPHYMFEFSIGGRYFTLQAF